MILYNSTPFKINYNIDKTLKLNVNPYIVSSKHIITWYFENNEEILELYYLVNHVKSKSRNPIHLIMPYIPGSIVDQPFDNSEIYTLKYFCDFINSLGFEKIRVLDPHSYVSVALLNNVEIYDIKPYIEAACDKTHSENLRIYFPTESDERKYSPYVNKPILGRNIGKDVGDHDILIITDYVNSSDEKLDNIVETLIKNDANKIYLYATHYDLNEVDIESKITKIFTSNSFPNRVYGKLEIIEGVI